MTGSSEESSRDSFEECYPNVLSRSGYQKLEQSLMVEKDQSRKGTSSENVETGVTSPPSPPFRHVKWKRA